MPTVAVNSIQTLRQQIKQRRRSLDEDQHLHWSQAICRRVLQSSDYAIASRVAAYLPFRGEVDPRPVLHGAHSDDKSVFVPVVNDNNIAFVPWEPDCPLVKNRYGIDEPATEGTALPAGELDLVLCPLVAFDRQCNRIGMGAGFYDRAFHFVRGTVKGPRLLGVAFGFQEVGDIDPQPWDIPLHAVVTEAEWIQAGTTD